MESAESTEVAQVSILFILSNFDFLNTFNKHLDFYFLILIGSKEEKPRIEKIQN